LASLQPFKPTQIQLMHAATVQFSATSVRTLRSFLNRTKAFECYGGRDKGSMANGWSFNWARIATRERKRL